MHRKMYRKDEANFWVLRAEKAGEMLSMHQHPPERHHITLCIQGRVLCHDEYYKWHQLLMPGDVCIFPHEGPHAVVALDADTILTQINLTPSKIPRQETDDQWLVGMAHPCPIADLDHINQLLAI